MGKIIALDSMIFIYLFEADPRFIKNIETIFRRTESGEINTLTSIISVIETLSPIKYLQEEYPRTEIVRFFQETPNLTVHSVNMEIGLKSAQLRREYPSLRTPDSIQLATAIIHKADAFVTNDAKLINLQLPQLHVQPC